MMGYDPLSIKFIRTAHELGLGCGDPREIEIVGDDAFVTGTPVRGVERERDDTEARRESSVVRESGED